MIPIWTGIYFAFFSYKSVMTFFKLIFVTFDHGIGAIGYGYYNTGYQEESFALRSNVLNPSPFPFYLLTSKRQPGQCPHL